MGQCLQVTSEVGTQQFERDFGAGLRYRIDALLVVVSAAVGEVITIHNGDDRMTQVHRGHGLSEVLRFFRVEGRRALDGPDGTKATASRAFLAGDHERCIAAGPAFVDVWTACLFAYGVKHVVLHGRFGAVEHSLLSAAG